MSIFSHVTQGDLQEVRHAIEMLDVRIERVRKAAKSANGREAGLHRRIKAIETLIKNAPEVPVDGYDSEDSGATLDNEEEEEDTETQRLRLGHG